LSREDSKRKYPTDEDYVFAYIKDVQDHVKDKYPEDTVGFNTRIDCVSMQFDNLMSVVTQDTGKALFSCIFVWIYLTQHMQSCMLSSLGMGVVILSFPFTTFITNFIFQVKYFGFL
jgi:hypothetical protein